MITNYSAIVIQFVATVALARLLTPSEVGTYAIAGSIFVIAQMFRDFGISTYLVREQNASREKIEGAIALSWIVCTFLAGLLFFSSPYIANFYDLPVLQTVLALLSFNIFIIPLGTWSQSQLKKEMKFRTIGAIQVTSQITHLIISITLALFEFGSVSLAIASFFATLMTVILTLWACPNHKKYRPRFSNVAMVFRATSTIGSANVIYQLSGNIHPIVLGKVLSEEAVAIFDKSAAILNIINMAFINAIQSVLTPYFALIKKDPGALKSTYFKINNYTAVVAWPFMIYASLHADLIVRTLFGDQWLAAVPLVPFACIGFAIVIIGRFFNEIAIAIAEQLKSENLTDTIEFYGAGLKNLNINTRACISALLIQQGAEQAVFPIDEVTLSSVKDTNKARIKDYAQALGIWHDEKLPAPRVQREIKINISST